MRIAALSILLVGSSVCTGAERRPIGEVDLTRLVEDSQVLLSTASTIDLAWWISAEYWEVSLLQNPSMPEPRIKEYMGILRPWSVLAVIQADVSAAGEFSFFDRDTLLRELNIEITREDGTKSVIPHTAPSNADLRLLLDMMRPVVASALGKMGENLFFFPLPDTDDDGNRLVSPYAPGTVRVRLAPRKGRPPPVVEIDFPLDALFVPRICPNGRPAHVSWAYCPWSGKKLE